MDMSIRTDALATARAFTTWESLVAPATVAVTRRYGALLQTRVRAHASGRPGPRVQTGDYRRNIGLQVGQDEAAVWAEVGTNSVQGRRLEQGFVGVDALGRHYNQPPYPHFGPAFEQTQPEYVQALGAAVVDDAAREAGR